MSLMTLRAVRLFLFAGTIAIAWLVLSAPSGTANTGLGSGSLLGTVSTAPPPVGSTVSGAAEAVGSGAGDSVAAIAGPAVAAVVPSTSEPARPAAVSVPVSGLVQSIPQTSTGPATLPVVSVPTVSGLAPTGFLPATPDLVSGVVAPVAGVVAPVTDAVLPIAAPVTDALLPIAAPVTDALLPIVAPVTDAVLPIVAPVTDAVLPIAAPVTDAVLPIVTPVTDAVLPIVTPVTDAVLPPLPGTVPAVTGVAVPSATDAVTGFGPGAMPGLNSGTSGQSTDGVTSGLPEADLVAPAGKTGPGLTEQAILSPRGALTGLLGTLMVPVTAVFTTGADFPAGAGPESPVRYPTGGNNLMPLAVSGSGWGQSSGGSQSPAAWFSSLFDFLPLPVAGLASGPVQHAPAPVSLDPGSSPD